MHIVDEGYKRAVEVLRMNVTHRGFSACSIQHDDTPHSNYRSVWARDSALTLMWALMVGDSELTDCSRRSLETILKTQTPEGHLPNYVDVVTGAPNFGGTGNIAGIDSAMWIVIAFWRYVEVTGDLEFARRHFSAINRAMRWVRGLDTNNCGLLEIPEAADWTDLFPRSYNVLYDEVLWCQANICFYKIQHALKKPYAKTMNRAVRIREIINKQFWPTPETMQVTSESFAEAQYSLGRTRYLIEQITPFGFSWRCDVYANILAYLYSVLDESRATQVYDFLRQVGVAEPHPVRILYPVVHPGDPLWRNYFIVNLQNLPHHYHNGGIWPFVGGLWVRFLFKLGKRKAALESLESLAMLCRAGLEKEWEFNEWAHGLTGRPMGKMYQAWSAASYVAAFLRAQGDTSLETNDASFIDIPEAKKEGTAPEVIAGEVDLDQPEVAEKLEV